MGGIVEKVIERNTAIPVSMAQEFTTYQDGQDGMLIHVVQGEREMVEQNRSLARFTLSGIPPMTAGAARIRVTFQVDSDGLLTVSAKEQTTGAEQTVAVKPTYGLSEDDMARMLYDSLENAKDDMNARLLAEARVDARRAALAVRAALAADGDLLSESEKIAIEAALDVIESAITADDRDTIREAAEGLETATKDFAERRMDRGISRALSGVELERLDERLQKT
jgi:molecular chaperone HscA